ncbi:MAG: hypothetical protein ACR2J8_04520 [Thermomicrobiales bacterium]
MDGPLFDSISRLIAASASRRSGIRAVTATLAAAASRAIPGIATPSAGASPRSRHVGPAGPCGPTGADNRCKKHKECCTGYCKPGRAGKPGRCRCIKTGKPCKKDQTCCGGATCQDKVCTIEPTCVATVCASGCPFTSVNAAYAASAPGSTIVIAPGTWTTGIVVTKSMTFSGCTGGGEVILRPDPAVNAPDGYPAIFAEDGVATTPYTITAEHLVLQGDGVASGHVIFSTNTKGNVSFIVTNCTGRDADTWLNALGGDHVFTNSNTEASMSRSFTCVFSGLYTNTGNASLTANGCVFLSDDNTMTLYGNTDAARVNSTFTMTDCTFTSTTDTTMSIIGGVSVFTGCRITGSGAGGVNIANGDFTFDDTAITGNTSSGVRGGIYVFSSQSATQVTLSGTTAVTNNTAPIGGAGINAWPTSPITVTGSSTTNVHSNIGPYQCATTSDGSNYTEVPDCASF